MTKGMVSSEVRAGTDLFSGPAGLPRAHTPHLRETTMEVCFKRPWCAKGFEE